MRRCRLRASASIVRTISIIVLVLVSASAGSAQDWAQFRGPAGLGVAAETPLPETFDPNSESLAWRAELRGAGISSPVVSRGRVFVTSAYEGEERSRLRRWAVVALITLVTLALGAAAYGWRARRSRQPEVAPERGWRNIWRRFDRLIVVAASLVFVALVVVITLEPQRIWSPGIPGDAWLVTSTVALIGLFGAFGGSPPGSRWRLIGALVLLVAGGLVLHHLPLNKHHSVYKLEYRAVMVAPAACGAFWFLCTFLCFARNRERGVGLAAVVTAFALVSLGAVMFLTTNFVNPKVGLVRSVTCLDFENGRQLWQTPLFVAPEERLHRQNSFATPTVCADGERLLAFFGPGYACLDYDGRVLWEGRDEQYHNYSHYGCVSSPIEFEDSFIVLQATESQNFKPSYMMALDKRTGNVLWRVSPARAHDCYMTPLLMPVAGVTQLVAVHFACLAGYDPRTGQLLWEQELPTWQHAPSLTHQEDVVLVSGGAHEKWVTAGVRLETSGAETKPTVLWQSTRAVPDSSSPVLHRGLFFTVSAGGIMVCYDPLSGAMHWRERIDGTCRASLVAGDGKVFVATEEGQLITVAASTEFKVLARSTIGEPMLASPAIQAGHMLLRGDRHLFCFEAKPN